MTDATATGARPGLVLPCPSCKTRFRHPTGRPAEGERFRCDRCGGVFRVKQPASAATPRVERAERKEPPARAALARTPAPVRTPRSFLRRNAVVLTLLGLLVAGSLAGLPYYVLPFGSRLRSPLHEWLKPSGYVGQAAGVVAFLLFVFLWLYPLRKKFRWLAFTGSMGRWLDVHIVVGILVPVLGAIHASWKFDGLIGLGYFSMVTVSLSGFVGRYLYSRIPHGRSGLELTIAEIEERRDAIVRRIADATGLEAEVVDAELRAAIASRTRPGGRLPRVPLLGLVSSDLARWRATRALRRRWRERRPGKPPVERAALKEAMRLARRQLALTQQVRMLDATHRLFRYWHVAHRPVAVTALLAVMVHVAVVVSLGVTWFW